MRASEEAFSGKIKSNGGFALLGSRVVEGPVVSWDPVAFAGVFLVARVFMAD